MAEKIPFTCIFSSDEDTPQYAASELNSHGPSVLGWRSKPDEKNEKVTKEIVLKFQYPAKIYKIQVLAHQFMIPERIEFWLHYSSKNATPSSQHFEYIGFISLSTASENFQSRELQSILITEKIGTHLKLRLGNPLENALNPHNQVALLAVNVLGEEFLSTLTDVNHLKIRHPANSDEPLAEVALASITNDLSYCMYVEESIVELVRKIENLKKKAVQDERFEYARKLKLCMNALRSAGERLGRYALAKRMSVLKEDFTAARLRKEQIEIYRKSVFESLEIEKLLEENGFVAENDVSSEIYAAKPILPAAPTLVEVSQILESQSAAAAAAATAAASNTNGTNTTENSPGKSKLSDDIPPRSPNLKLRSSPRDSPRTGSLRRRNKSAPRIAQDFDEREIPTLRHSHTNEFLRECHHQELNIELARSRSKLNDREKRQASVAILVFGLDMVELFYARQFQDREDGLSQLREILKSSGEEGSSPQYGYNKTTRATTLLLHRAVRDAVFSVFSAATETIRTLFCDFIPGKVTNSEISRCVDKLLPELLSKSGDPSPRVHNLAQHTILTIAACGEVQLQNLVAPQLTRQVTNGTHPRLALSRLQMVEQLILSQGISQDKQSGMTPRILSECGISGLNHAHELCRKVSERILLAVYKMNPRLIRKQLPPDDEITRRNLLYRQLFVEFDKIDSQRKNCKMTFSFYERSNSVGESSKKPSSSKQNGNNNEDLADHVRNLNLNDRASPQPMRHNYQSTNHIMKSKSGHSFKDFNSK